MKYGFIGCGKMATALVQGILKAGLCSPGDIIGSDTHTPAANKLAESTGITKAASNAEVVNASEVVVLAVKPGDALGVLESLSGQTMGSAMRWAWKGGDGPKQTKLLLSIVAGLSLARMEAVAGERFRIVRAMPNTPALILQGATGFACGSRTTPEDAEWTQRIFSSVGVTVQVKEALLDVVTGLSGSGPAYVYTVIEAMADGGVLMGLPRDLALQLAAQTVVGAASMVLRSGQHPAALRDQVASPGGTTIAGISALEEAGLRAALIGAVRAATLRAQELGK